MAGRQAVGRSSPAVRVVAVRQPRRQLTPDERALQFAVSRARPPRTDPTGERLAEVVEIAKRYGLDVDDMIEWFEERAAVRRWDGGYDNEEAERLAVGDVEEIAALRAQP